MHIHLNNAGAALPAPGVLKTQIEYLRYEALTGGYEAAEDFSSEIEDFYPALAQLLNTQPDHIAWAASATDAYARALSVFDWQKGDTIVTTQQDYVSNQLAFFSLRERFGVSIIRAAEKDSGGVDPQDMERLIDQYRPRLVAVTHIPTNSGLVQPVEQIGQICRAYNVFYLVDACQSAGQRHLDVQAIGCDFLTATMRKFLRGPRGAGFLYASDRMLHSEMTMLMPDLIGATWTGPDQWKQVNTAKKFEYFEYSPALKMGSAVAVRYLLSLDMAKVQQKIEQLSGLFRTELSRLPSIRVLDKGETLGGIVTCVHRDADSLALRTWLRTCGIHSSVSSFNSAVIDFTQKGVASALRLSPHYYNTEEEILRTVEVIGRFEG